MNPKIELGEWILGYVQREQPVSIAEIIFVVKARTEYKETFIRRTVRILMDVGDLEWDKELRLVVPNRGNTSES